MGSERFRSGFAFGHGCTFDRRRGAALVLVAVLMPVMIGMAALTVDVAYLFGVRNDLQNAADAAALAGVSALASDQMMQLRMGTEGSFSPVQNLGTGRVSAVSALNPSLARQMTLFSTDELAFGWLDLTSGTSPLQVGAPVTQYNAMRVEARRTADSQNGPIELMFARVFGLSISEVTASAAAAFDDRAAGFDTTQYPGGVLPVTVHEAVFEADFSGGPDDYEYDPATGSIYSGSDGIREVHLYPHDNAPGNFGLLNIGTPNQGTPALRSHIEDGVPPEDFEAETGSAVLTFYDDNGSSVTYGISGNPGLKASLESSFETRLGQVVGFFLHNATSGTGANTVYTIKGMRFGRLVHVNLNGNNKALYVQPTTYAGAGVVVSSSAPSSGGLLGHVVLVR